MPRLGIGPSSFTGHQAAAKVHKKLRCTLPSRFIVASTKHVHMHTHTTSSRQAKTITAVALSLLKRMDTNHGWGSDPAQRPPGRGRVHRSIYLSSIDWHMHVVESHTRMGQCWVIVFSFASAPHGSYPAHRVRQDRSCTAVMTFHRPESTRR